MSNVDTSNRLPPTSSFPAPLDQSLQPGLSRAAVETSPSTQSQSGRASSEASRPLSDMPVRKISQADSSQVQDAKGATPSRDLCASPRMATGKELAFPEWQMHCPLKPINSKIDAFLQEGLIPAPKPGLWEFLAVLPLAKPEDRLAVALKKLDFAGMRQLMRPDSPQFVALSALIELGKDSKSRSVAISQNFMALAFTPELDLQRDKAEQIILERRVVKDRGDCAALALGSTHPWASGQPLRCQDGAYVSPYATVVTDGLGGHEPHDATLTRLSQRAAGLLLSSAIESTIATQKQPAAFLEAHASKLMQFVDWVSLATQFSAVPENGLDPEARTAVVAIANCPDGVVAFGVGDCTALLAKISPTQSLEMIEFTPQRDAKSARAVGGLGEGTYDPAAKTWLVERHPAGSIVGFVAGSDGGLPKACNLAMRELFATQVTQSSFNPEATLNALLDELATKAIAQRRSDMGPAKELLGQGGAVAEVAKEGKSKPAADTPKVELDDVCLVVRGVSKDSSR